MSGFGLLAAITKINKKINFMFFTGGMNLMNTNEDT
jgi:hypothetical protein